MNPEDEYKELAGELGYENACLAANCLGQDPTSRRLFFTAMLNAYWRGVNNGVTQARAIVRQVTEARTGGKSN